MAKPSGINHTVLPANTPCLPFLRKRSPDGATPNWGRSQLQLTTHKLSPVSCRSRTRQGKFAAPSQTVATARIAPKVFQSQPSTLVSRYSKFHPNRFTFGGVIAERMKTVLWAHRVNPLFVRKPYRANNNIQPKCVKYSKHKSYIQQKRNYKNY